MNLDPWRSMVLGVLVAIAFLSIAEARSSAPVYDALADPTWSDDLAAAAASWGRFSEPILVNGCGGARRGALVCKDYVPDAPYAWAFVGKRLDVIAINSWWDERTSYSDSPAGGSQHVRQYIACHELGHALGLPEIPWEEGCMGGNPAYYLPSVEDLKAVK